MSADDDLTDGGYRIVKPSPQGRSVEKGIECGVCKMRFDHDKAYGYYCPNSNCPIFLKAY